MTDQVSDRGYQSPTVILRVKEAVRQRDGYRCTKCGLPQADHVAQYGRRLDVHRLAPGSLYTPEGCVTLCKRCHGPEPRLKKGEPSATRGPSLFLSLSADEASALAAFIGSQAVPPKAAAVLRKALRDFFAERGLWPPKKP